MLSVMLFEADEAVQARILRALNAIESKPALRITFAGASSDEMMHHVQTEDNIILAILCLSRHPVDNRSACMCLGDMIMQKNRDNYVLYCLHDTADFEALAWKCMRPAGIILPPIGDNRLHAVLRRITDDYAAIHADEHEDKNCLLVQSGTTAHRIAFSQICYLEAIDKKVTIYTHRQSIVLRKTLGSIAQGLSSRFVHCHRSYIVNLDCIASVDFSQMTIELSNGDILPVSRSCKDMLRQHLRGAKEASL